MKKRLRTLRITLSAALGIMLTLLIATTVLPHGFSAIAKIQLMPALLSLNIGILAFWLVATSLLGRVYCSTICPLGLFQDICARIGKLLKKKPKRRYRYSAAHNRLRYAVLAATIIAGIAGAAAVPSLLDPYSAFVRMVGAIVAPSAIGIAVGGITFVTIGALAFSGGRTFCNTVCPVGATLSLASRKPMMRIQIDTSLCIGCRRCEAECKASCIDAKNHTVDMSRCVMCLDCIPACHDNAITYSPAQKKSLGTGNDGRRRFLGFVGLAVAGTLAAKADSAAKTITEGKSPAKKKAVVPPGASSRDSFLSHCTACHLCVSKCPQGIIRPSATEYGILHMLQPHLDYSLGYCLHECNLCTQVCPDGALKPLSLGEKQSHAVGKAKFVLKNCVTQTDGSECGLCSRKCPVGAIDMVEHGDTLIPQVNEAICVGCGKCEYACPATPEKAIYVEGI